MDTTTFSGYEPPMIRSRSANSSTTTFKDPSDLEQTKPKTLRLPSACFESAGQQLLAGGSDIVIAENVSLDSYLNYAEQDDKHPVRFRLENGTILAHEVPSHPHAAAQGRVTKWIDQLLDHVDQLPTVNMIVGPNSVYEPDVAFRPLRRPRPPAAQGMN
ncbi:hypothetical protein BC937DRAFT_95457 [Endogone sp. FLAS-F59071]|nr:hypothetical protein BC937DRAFT_95457 [Endogone sp. FLAS-F59071]|eukprot:RUS20340.1 hypothetical protein BC937DRAFT_95457 [Endogone sp. FLAS-F59071]